MASPNLSELITTTLYNRSGMLADNVTGNNALLRRLRSKGNLKLKSGGRQIVQEMDYAENGTFQYYSGYDTLNTAQSDVLSASVWDWKQAAVSVVMSGLEQLQNAGKEQSIDLLEGRIKNAERTMMNNISAGIYSDGTGSGGKQIGGLQAVVADSPSTGTVGGINRATYSFWRNIVWDATTDGSATSATTIQSNMNGLYVQLVRGTDKPDLIVMDNVYYKFFLASLQAIQRIGKTDVGEAGFESLKYMHSDVVLDGGYSGDAPASHAYFLNTNYLFFVTHKERNFVPISPDRFAVNQDAMAKLIGWAGNLVCSNCFLQGVYKE